MNKTDLAKRYAKNMKIKDYEAKEQVDTLLLTIAEMLEEGAKNEPQGSKQVLDKLTLVGFGNFVLRRQNERTYRNPQGGEPVVKPAHNVLDFEPGKMIKELIN